MTDYPFPAGPEPCRQDCSDCRFAGYDGDYGTLPTCDGPIELHGDDDSDAYDEAEARIDAWHAAGQAGPCPLWHGADWCNTGAMEELQLHLETSARAEGLIP